MSQPGGLSPPGMWSSTLPVDEDPDAVSALLCEPPSSADDPFGPDGGAWPPAGGASAKELNVAQNCWEFKNCGRQPGGAKVAEMGVCPAAVDTTTDGVNGGRHGGRACWAVTGTFCGGTVQGTFAQKQLSCLTCEFLAKVKAEQGPSFRLMPSGQSQPKKDVA